MQHCLITSLLLSMNLFANKTDRCAVLATQCEKERNLFFSPVKSGETSAKDCPMTDGI